MPYQVQQIIEGKGAPVCITKDEPVLKALALMIEHEYSQLPVITAQDGIEIPDGMVTYEGILRGIRNFKARIDDLRVRDVMVDAPVYSVEDDLFDILDRMKDTNAVLVISSYAPDLLGIVTSYDTAEYFRKRTEDLMRVEDIELMIKDFIKTAHTDLLGETDETKISGLVAQVTAYKKTGEKANGQNEKELTFADLTMAEYISLLLHKETWAVLEPVFGVQRNFVAELLNGVREIRNALAHFRGDISPEQRDRLKFGAEWLSRRQAEYQTLREKQKFEKYEFKFVPVDNSQSKAPTEQLPPSTVNVVETFVSSDFSVADSANGGGRYAALADWLQSRPGKVDQVVLTFNQIEEIVGSELPASARSHRAWWANDSVGHTQSQLWLEAGWRTTYINLSEGRITFSRIREREKAYIAFFSKLLDDLRKKASFSLREVSPDGASWIVIQTIRQNGTTPGMFTFSFSRDRRLRVELYLDLGDQTQTKAVFDKLFAQKEQLEAKLGEIDWERLNNRRASRLALYKEGHISEENGHAELRKWAAETMTKFYEAIQKPAEKAVTEVLQG